ncbi:alpha-amylase 3, chloroplastic-like isoform X2 [Telopea speciosissima]|uniref:alpha-amylase 3, chloroplastic-like isoform X2 n=1 Tax=Telopea speciosissima TaxID=54955 RepID=UPI001CC3FBA2|nr:alpha-amylase 3, chloroplastic-like isoform X2 [Telopea speciosissima]
MSTVRLDPLLLQCLRIRSRSKQTKLSYLNYSPPKLAFNGGSFYNFKPRTVPVLRASSTTDTATLEISEASEVTFQKSFTLRRTQTVEGKVSVKLEQGKDEENWRLTVGCNLPGKWVLHWGVNYIDEVGSEWDQPPPEMRPPGSVPMKDYAIETPLKNLLSTSEGKTFHELQINFNTRSSIATINFVLKDKETGAWCQHKGRDFKVPLMDYLHKDSNLIGNKKGFSIWSGALGQLSAMLLKPEKSQPKDQDDNSEPMDTKQKNRNLEGFCEEHSILKEVRVENYMTVSVAKSPEKDKNVVRLETDLPGDVVVHWGVCTDNDRRWEIPAGPHPPGTKIYKKMALQTLLQPKEDGYGSWGLFYLDKKLMGFLFVLNLNDKTWLNYTGSDFYIPLSNASSFAKNDSSIHEGAGSSSVGVSGKTKEASTTASDAADPDGIINEIRNLVSDISSEKSRKTKSKEWHEYILQEIEKLAAEAYSIFRGSSPAFVEESTAETETLKSPAEALKPPAKVCSGTGSGYEILCQGFNWESHKSRRWYVELKEKVNELASLGFTVIWLPPPTESVSPEGYMPKDLYNLNSRYGNMEELKILVKSFHEVGIKVLGDVVLNHRCAQYQNKNGVWNIFGGKLNWDDRAVVADDPHFQGRGNKSSGDNFHAAPNIDHSQDFVREDLKGWLCWLRKEIGYDGWRLDFVRGFWGGYVKDYLEASGPYFAVGEYWDSLSYKYGELAHNQDAHRQRIIDWINATNGTAGAFDVTTKGILHDAIGRCQYWRLSDQKGKPPGVVGWWPSRAVTFIENHDTGSTQGHWRFPGGKEMQGYAYILTHPGTPAVFYDHIFSHYWSEISALLSLRHRMNVHCRSTVQIAKAENDVYAAIIDEKLAMKIGPGHYEPPSGPQRWSLALQGNDYKVWESL